MPWYCGLLLIWYLKDTIIKYSKVSFSFTFVLKFQTGCPAISVPSNCFAILSNTSLDHSDAISGGKTPFLWRRTQAPGNSASMALKR